MHIIEFYQLLLLARYWEGEMRDVCDEVLENFNWEYVSSNDDYDE
jgi:hypothetical protein